MQFSIKKEIQMKNKFEIKELRDNAKKVLKSDGLKTITKHNLSLEQAIEEINIYHIELEMQVEELQKNRAELERSKRYLKYIFDYAPVGYVILNNDGFIRDANVTALAYFGYEKEFFLDFQLKNFITADTYTNYHKCMRDLEDLKVIQHTELKFRNKSNATFWARVDLSYHSDIIEDQVLLCSILDITQRKEAEKDLKEKQAQLTHADRLTSLGEMATGMAHELNQPLSRIRVNTQGVQILLEKYKNITDNLPDTLNKRISAIIHEVDRAALIIDHMRGFARSKGEQKIISIREPIENSLNFFNEQFKHHNIQLTFDYEDDLPTIFSDPQLFEQVIVNLLSNARYAVDQKEHVLEKNHDTEPYQKRVTISLYKESDEFIVLKVSDNGIGMSDSEKKSCMEPFFTTKNVGEGTGLGLSIVRNIVKECFGSIRIESKKNYGTDICIPIPLNQNSGVCE